MSKDKSSSLSIWDDVSEKLESLREALNNSVEESDSSDTLSEESDFFPNSDDNNAVSFRTFDIESLREILNTPIDEASSSHEHTEEPPLLSQNYDHNTEELSTFNNEKVELDQVEQIDIPEIPTESIEETDPVDNEDANYHPISNDQIQITNWYDELDNKQEDKDTEVIDNTDDNKDSEDIVDPIMLDQQLDKTQQTEDKQEDQDIEIRINTKQSVKNEKIDNYWKQGETTNPYIKQVDESREVLNKSLEKARELVNRQSVETPKQEKKRFQLNFIRGEKNENQKSNTPKDKHSKKSVELKPMVYEILELMQDYQPSEPNLTNQEVITKQDIKAKQEKQPKEKTRQLDNRATNSQEIEIANFRNRLEKSKSLGIPVFVKKPVNLEQIRQLKSVLATQYNAKILVDTGSSQGRLLVISGPDPDTLLNGLSQLTMVKNTTIENETINLVLQTSDNS